ncbi:MAG TPA: Xaa-Pro peptidase family protein [Methylomirabilota bacterium]|nr:Xaa-Pro peptidase family protein [Methylomirabilota bacterium]
MSRPTYAAFGEAEHRERLARARQALRHAGFDGAIVVAPEHLFYLAGYDSWVSVNSPQALIFGIEEDVPTLVLRNVDQPLARETSWVADIRTYHLHRDDVPALIAGVVAEKRIGGPGRIAIETQSYALTHAFGLELAKALGPVVLADATELLGELRVIKSPAELAYLRAAARFAEIGLGAARRHAAPGVSEIAFTAEIEAAMRRAGSDYWSIPIELASGPRTPGGHATPRERVMQPGDLVHMEFAGVSHRYHAAAIHTLALGEPSKRAREIYRLAVESLAAGIAATRIGAPVSAVEEASLEPLRKVGLEHAATMRFGYGIGIAYPPIWLETLQISRGFDRRLAANMVFVLHACLELPDEHIGVIQGGTYLLSETGLEMLVGAGAVELEVR